MTSTTRVAAVQMVSGPDVAANLAAAAQGVAEAAARGAQCVVLPEYFALIASDDSAKLRVAEADGEGPLQAFLADTARTHGVWLVGGSLPLRSDDPLRVRNSLLAYDARGRRVARYDKVHLFGFQREGEAYDEARSIQPGSDLVSFDAPFGRIGVGICYDLRFPEFFRALGDVTLTVLPAAFTETTGRAHWEVLLRARAIENQCYVLAAAQGGQHPSGRRTYGHSMLIDPWGEVLDCLPTGPGVVVGDIDPARLATVRQSLPALCHRRF